MKSITVFSQNRYVNCKDQAFVGKKLNESLEIKNLCSKWAFFFFFFLMFLHSLLAEKRRKENEEFMSYFHILIGHSI